MKKILLIFITLIVFSSQKSNAQEFQAYLVEDIPVQHMIGLKFRFKKNYSIHAGFGVLSQFYKDTYIANASTSNVFEQNTKNFLEKYYDSGFSLTVGGDYYYNDWYAGVYFQNFTIYADPQIYALSSDLLYGNESKINPVGDYSHTIAKIRIYNYNAGVHIGRELALTRDFKIKAELGCAYSFYVKTNGYTDIYSIKSTVEDLVDKTMRPDIVKMFQNKFTPSLRLGVIWRIGAVRKSDVGLFSKRKASDLPKWE